MIFQRDQRAARPEMPFEPELPELAGGKRVAVERTIPIVFTGVADPVASGVVARPDRPSGNITGFASTEATLGGKWLELLSEVAPGLKRVAIMFNPDVNAVSA
jgi:putative ABC transport system substrate-binding protein